LAKTQALVLAGGVIHDYKGCGAEIAKALSESGEFEVTYREEDLNVLVALEPYDLVALYYTYGEIAEAQKNGLLNFVASGKGFVGIHSAIGSFLDAPEYLAMLGGRFVTHPPYRNYQVSVVDSQHPITRGLTEFWVRDEQYIMEVDPRVQVLCSALWKGGVMPVAWTKPWGKGRVFYLALGHDQPACAQEIFRKLLVAGALWAAAGTSLENAES